MGFTDEDADLLTGVALLLASVIAGALWDAMGYQATFAFGALLATLTAVGLWSLRHSQHAML